MRAFEIHLNGKRLCTAGIDGDGVLTAIIRSATAPGKRSTRSREDLALEIGGLLSDTAESVRWKSPRLRPGDEIYLRVADVKAADRPTRRAGAKTARRQSA